MANLSTKIKLYLTANSKTWNDTKVELQDDGDGAYIKSWTYDIAEPTAEQIASYETAGNAAEANAVIDALTSMFSVDAARQSSESKGEDAPLANESVKVTETTADGQVISNNLTRMNRRVEFVIEQFYQNIYIKKRLPFGSLFLGLICSISQYHCLYLF